MTNENDIESRLSGLEIKIKGLEQMFNDIDDRLTYCCNMDRLTKTQVDMQEKVMKKIAEAVIDIQKELRGSDEV